MTIFYLPDLGEGLAEAVIHEWHTTKNNCICTDDPMLSVETAKSIVEIPAPYTGKVTQLFAQAGQTVKVGEPLIDIESDATATVAGKLETSDIILDEESFDHLPTITITSNITKFPDKPSWQDQAESLSGIRLSMSKNMQKAQREVVLASIFEQADVSHWPEKTDITVNIIQAMCVACQTEPALNAWFDGRMQKRLLHPTVNIGLALDTPEGLLVPVLKQAELSSITALRQMINQYKQHQISPDSTQNATITLSNIGRYAGLFATPIVVPPTVAIVAIGRMTRNNSDNIKLLPLSLSFDHRAVTGAEAARFLQAMLHNIADQT